MKKFLFLVLLNSVFNFVIVTESFAQNFPLEGKPCGINVVFDKTGKCISECEYSLQGKCQDKNLPCAGGYSQGKLCLNEFSDDLVSHKQQCCNPSDAAGGGNEATPGCKFTGSGEEKCQLENPIGVGTTGTTEVSEIIKVAINVVLGIIGALTLLMLVYGGFQWLTSAGNEEKVTAGTQTMTWALVGVMLVFASYLLLSTFLNFLTQTP